MRSGSLFATISSANFSRMSKGPLKTEHTVLLLLHNLPRVLMHQCPTIMIPPSDKLKREL
jgi:hypothetical protein